MTVEELKRLRYYSDRINAAHGDVSVLKPEESRDLEELLRKRLARRK